MKTQIAFMFAAAGLFMRIGTRNMGAQSAGWQSVVWREPQVRYLLADMSLGGDVAMYRTYAKEDPDSREAIRLWDAGVRVVNLDEFERKKANGATRITRKGNNQRISGSEVKLSTD